MKIRACGCIGIMMFAALMFVVTGVMQVAEGARFPAPKTITFDKFVKEHPTEGWFHITGGYLSIAEGAHITRKKENSTEAATPDRDEVYLPLRSTTKVDPKMDTLEAPIDVLVMSWDQKILDNYWKFYDMSEEQIKHVKGEELVVKTDMEGMVGSILHSATEENKTALEKGLKNLTPDYILFEDGARPSKGSGAASIIGGILLGVVSLGLLVLLIARWRA